MPDLTKGFQYTPTIYKDKVSFNCIPIILLDSVRKKGQLFGNRAKFFFASVFTIECTFLNIGSLM